MLEKMQVAENIMMQPVFARKKRTSEKIFSDARNYKMPLLSNAWQKTFISNFFKFKKLEIVLL